MSLTLDAVGIKTESITFSCVNCKNAIWQKVEETNDARSNVFFNFKNQELNEKNLTCWCMVQHQFIRSPRILCDGNPEFINLDKFITVNQ